MEKLSRQTINKRTLHVWKSTTVEGVWFCRNTVLNDTYTTESVGEVRDLIADNTPLSLEDIRTLVGMIEDGKLHAVTFNLSDDDYEGE